MALFHLFIKSVSSQLKVLTAYGQEMPETLAYHLWNIPRVQLKIILLVYYILESIVVQNYSLFS